MKKLKLIVLSHTFLSLSILHGSGVTRSYHPEDSSVVQMEYCPVYAGTNWYSTQAAALASLEQRGATIISVNPASCGLSSIFDMINAAIAFVGTRLVNTTYSTIDNIYNTVSALQTTVSAFDITSCYGHPASVAETEETQLLLGDGESRSQGLPGPINPRGASGHVHQEQQHTSLEMKINQALRDMDALEARQTENDRRILELQATQFELAVEMAELGARFKELMGSMNVRDPRPLLDPERTDPTRGSGRVITRHQASQSSEWLVPEGVKALDLEHTFVGSREGTRLTC